MVDPRKKYVEGKKNEDMFFNLAAQAMWALRERFVKTYNAVQAKLEDPDFSDYEPEGLISLPKKLPYLNDLVTEISIPL